jgi:signal transduction histidine kinase
MNTAQVTSILLALTALPYILLVGIILKRGRPRRGAVNLLLLYVAISFLWTLVQVAFHLSWPTAVVPAFAARLMLYGLVISSWLFFHLTHPFLGLAPAGRIWWILPAAWIGLIVILSEDPFSLGWLSASGVFEADQIGFALLFLTWSGLVSGAALVTARTHHRTLQPLRRNRIKYWFLALALSVIGAASLFAGQDLLASALHLLGTLTASYVILSHGLLDVRQMMRQSFSYAFATLLALSLYLAALFLSERLLGALSSYSTMVAGAAIAWVLALIFGPLLRLVQRLVNRFTRGTSYDPGSTLREYSAKISGILELDHLAREIVELVCEKMAVQRGTLFLVHYSEQEEEREDGVISLESIADSDSPGPLTLSPRSPITSYLERRRQPLTQYDIDILPFFKETPIAERQCLTELDMDVYVPVFGKGRWIGLLALGRRISGDRFFEDDLALLATLADQTAVALENARLYEDLRMRNAENERLNQQLTAANVELARVGQAKSDFIDIASHELRTPLTQVTGYNEMLGEMLETGSLEQSVGVEMTGRVRLAADRLERIVATMLDVSRIDTETLDLDLAPVQISMIIRQVASFWSAALDQRRQILETSGVDQLPIVIADGERLEQLFASLVQNAIKYTPDGGHIRISGRLIHDSRPRTVEIVVADTGVGIAREDLGRIFDKFYRVDDVLFHSSGDTKFKGAGPGLGLTIARGIVEAHGGAIWAESRGRDEEAYPGAEFHVLIPERPQPLELARLEPAEELETQSR